MHEVENGHGWVEATPHRDQDGERERHRKRKTGSGRESQTTGEDSYKPWSDFGGQRPPPSCHFSYMQWDGERPSLKEDKSPAQYGKKGRYKNTEKKRRAQGLDRLEPTWRKKRRIIVLIFQWKKKCLFDHWVIQNKETVQEIAQTLQWKPSVTEKKSWNQVRTHTHTHWPTHTQTCGHRSSRNPNPKYKDSETRTPTITAYEAVLHCWQKSKEILARLSKVVPTKKYKQWSKIYKFTWCHIGAG